MGRFYSRQNQKKKSERREHAWHQSPFQYASRAQRADQRLSRRFRRLIDRGKSSQKAVTAVARELVGFVWAIAQEEQLLAA